MNIGNGGELPPEKEAQYLKNAQKACDEAIEPVIIVEAMVAVAAAEWLCKVFAADAQVPISSEPTPDIDPVRRLVLDVALQQTYNGSLAEVEQASLTTFMNNLDTAIINGWLPPGIR